MTLRTYTSSIYSACASFGAPQHPDKVLTQLNKIWKNLDGSKESPAMPMGKAPDLHAAVKKLNACEEFKIKLWTMFLVSVGLMARASEVTTYCPTYEDMEVPPKNEPSNWDVDGFPKYLVIALRFESFCDCMNVNN